MREFVAGAAEVKESRILGLLGESGRMHAGSLVAFVPEGAVELRALVPAHEAGTMDDDCDAARAEPARLDAERAASPSRRGRLECTPVSESGH